MLTFSQLENKLNTNPLVRSCLDVLKLAEEINTDFRNPHIIGGFLRNIALDKNPNDCDVVFQGYQLNQPGILECVREAEKILKVAPYPDWEFENITATSQSSDFKESTVGRFSNHTDYLTCITMDVEGELEVGGEKTLHDLNDRVFDLRFEGVEVWANHRGNGRSYASCLMGDLTRGLYLCSSLELRPSAIVSYLFSNYDILFNKLGLADQLARKNYWLKKTKAAASYKKILDHYQIKSLGA